MRSRGAEKEVIRKSWGPFENLHQGDQHLVKLVYVEPESAGTLSAKTILLGTKTDRAAQQVTA